MFRQRMTKILAILHVQYEVCPTPSESMNQILLYLHQSNPADPVETLDQPVAHSTIEWSLKGHGHVRLTGFSWGSIGVHCGPHSRGPMPCRRSSGQGLLRTTSAGFLALSFISWARNTLAAALLMNPDVATGSSTSWSAASR